jgi:hypothetical protein
MRALFGIILGVAITIGGAYLYDSSHAMSAANGTGAIERPLVNWDVVGQKWQIVSARAAEEWRKLAS